MPRADADGALGPMRQFTTQALDRCPIQSLETTTPFRGPGLVTLPMCLGSLGHPELCARPCLKFLSARCDLGASCPFCHLEHARAVKPDRRQREALQRLSESELMELLLKSLSLRAQSVGLYQDIFPMLQQLHERLSLGTIVRSDLSRACLSNLEKLLGNMSVKRMVLVLRRSVSVDLTFLEDLLGQLDAMRFACISTSAPPDSPESLWL